MKKRVPIILTLIVCFSMCGCSEKDSSKESIIESVEESVSASVSESLAEESDAARLEMEVLKQEVVDEMVGPFDCFAVGETATLQDVELTVIGAKYVEATKKFNGKQADYAVEISFEIKNNSMMVYQPLGDLTLSPYNEIAESFTSYMTADERAEYDAGVQPGETKAFRIRSQYNSENPLVVLARWAPGSSVITQENFVAFYDINPALGNPPEREEK